MNAQAEAVVTGVGAVTCHGAGADELWRAMTAAGTRLPDRPADPLALMDLPLINLVPGLGLPGPHEPGPGPTSERATRFASLAAAEALADAGLDTGALDAVRSAVVLGSCMGEPEVNERGRGGQRWEPPFRLASALAGELGLFGTAVDVANACAAGGYALGVALDLVRSGQADVVIAGGSDAYSRVALGCFNRLGAVDPERCRPFERDRAGTVFAEGAGVLVVESAAHARARGALDTGHGRVLSLSGVGWSCDGDHPTAPREDGEEIVRAMRRALGEPPYDVGCVVPHGTGTRLNDVLESRLLRRVLGTGRVPLYSLKGLLGHAGGASAALGVVAGALILRHGTVPGNVPLKEQDPQCEVWLPEDSVPLGARRVLVNAYGFGGNNASVVLGVMASASPSASGLPPAPPVSPSSSGAGGPGGADSRSAAGGSSAVGGS
ncbi:beta-ketoacyl synthase [Streptomyces sp. NRRL B-24085]|uniref:beta-ketoacyl-[acyl-carrier-protein] synthase family protein n=1 Tax=Streptomyces sp. NRRL B-24085 TaxID=1709476 RepID=UPI0007C70D9E|nr:beta-ketoacyl synthase N-terminal-like domain-containing protein [Streptomyces sp. NRRL B-24085]